MNNKIKEILDLLKRCDNTYLKIEDNDGKTKYEYQKVNDLRLDGYHSQLLLDYITNLQEENENLKNIVSSIKKDFLNANSETIELETRIDKAIEEIELYRNRYTKNLDRRFKGILNILQGSDKE